MAVSFIASINNVYGMEVGTELTVGELRYKFAL